MPGTPRWMDALPARAQDALPAPVWSYFVAGAREGLTASEAVEAWRRIRLAPHALRDVAEVDASVTLLGSRYAAPFGVAPTSMQRAAHPEGELAMARATARSGVPHVVSSNAGHPFADIGALGPFWLQAYLNRDRASSEPWLRAAVDAGATAVVLTVDTPVVGTKYQPAEADWASVDLSWHRGNILGHVSASEDVWARNLTEADLGWLADVTGLPVVAKGVLRGDDARRCVDAGAAAVWVSNHGGRQLDRVRSTAEALPEVVAAVDGRAEVYVDGGIRSGLDVLTALALGADAAFLGRLPLFALAAEGDEGVARLLGELAAEVEEGLRLSGCTDVAQTRDLVPGARGKSARD